MVSCVSVCCEFLGEWSQELTADACVFDSEVISKIVSS